ncbi:MAG: hypothetical protein K8T20_20255 [Planctomycetes bacterium]|nr:hypothetical protein [Planctomycetota bacterium]
MRLFSRVEAARFLAARIRPHLGGRPFVLASSRNAMPLARDLSAELGCELDIVLAQELDFPGGGSSPVGAVTENGEVLWNFREGSTSIDEERLADGIVRAIEALLQRRSRYTPDQSPSDLAGCTAIVVGDGIADGSMMVEALQAARSRRPARLIAAVAAATPAALHRIRLASDDMVCLEVAESYSGVARTLGGVSPVTEERAMQILREAMEPSVTSPHRVARDAPGVFQGTA